MIQQWGGAFRLDPSLACVWQTYAFLKQQGVEFPSMVRKARMDVSTWCVLVGGCCLPTCCMCYDSRVLVLATRMSDCWVHVWHTQCLTQAWDTVAWGYFAETPFIPTRNAVRTLTETQYK